MNQLIISRWKNGETAVDQILEESKLILISYLNPGQAKDFGTLYHSELPSWNKPIWNSHTGQLKDTQKLLLSMNYEQGNHKKGKEKHPQIILQCIPEKESEVLDKLAQKKEQWPYLTYKTCSTLSEQAAINLLLNRSIAQSPSLLFSACTGHCQRILDWKNTAKPKSQYAVIVLKATPQQELGVTLETWTAFEKIPKAEREKVTYAYVSPYFPYLLPVPLDKSCQKVGRFQYRGTANHSTKFVTMSKAQGDETFQETQRHTILEGVIFPALDKLQAYAPDLKFYRPKQVCHYAPSQDNRPLSYMNGAKGYYSRFPLQGGIQIQNDGLGQEAKDCQQFVEHACQQWNIPITDQSQNIFHLVQDKEYYAKRSRKDPYYREIGVQTITIPTLYEEKSQMEKKVERQNQRQIDKGERPTHDLQPEKSSILRSCISSLQLQSCLWQGTIEPVFSWTKLQESSPWYIASWYRENQQSILIGGVIYPNGQLKVGSELQEAVPFAFTETEQRELRYLFQILEQNYSETRYKLLVKQNQNISLLEDTKRFPISTQLRSYPMASHGTSRKTRSKLAQDLPNLHELLDITFYYDELEQCWHSLVGTLSQGLQDLNPGRVNDRRIHCLYGEPFLQNYPEFWLTPVVAPARGNTVYPFFRQLLQLYGEKRGILPYLSIP